MSAVETRGGPLSESNCCQGPKRTRFPTHRTGTVSSGTYSRSSESACTQQPHGDARCSVGPVTVTAMTGLPQVGHGGNECVSVSLESAGSESGASFGPSPEASSMPPESAFSLESFSSTASRRSVVVGTIGGGDSRPALAVGPRRRTVVGGARGRYCRLARRLSLGGENSDMAFEAARLGSQSRVVLAPGAFRRAPSGRWLPDTRSRGSYLGLLNSVEFGQ